MWKANQTSHRREQALAPGGLGVTDMVLQAPDFSRLATKLQYFSRFFTPFLSCKGLVSRRLQRNHGLIKSRPWQMEI
jgi:hypothetical protein